MDQKSIYNYYIMFIATESNNYSYFIRALIKRWHYLSGIAKNSEQIKANLDNVNSFVIKYVGSLFY